MYRKEPWTLNLKKVKREHQKKNNDDLKVINKVVKGEIEEASKKFSRKIRNQRNKLKLSMVSLYKLSGVSSSTISDIEHGHYLPHLEVMLKLGYALNLSKSDILSVFGNLKKSDNSPMEQLVKILGELNFSEDKITEIIDFIKFKINKSKKDTNSHSFNLFGLKIKIGRH